jgi:hypothetical protein
MPVVDDRVVVNDRLVDIRVVNDRPVHMHDRGIVSKTAATPLTAGEADSHVAKPIVHAAVVADMRAPVAIMEKIVPTFKAPVRRGPQSAGIRRRHPGARNPIVAIIAVGPVARRPHVSILRAIRLNVNRQYRRRNTDADKHSGK